MNIIDILRNRAEDGRIAEAMLRRPEDAGEPLSSILDRAANEIEHLRVEQDQLAAANRIIADQSALIAECHAALKQAESAMDSPEYKTFWSHAYEQFGAYAGPAIDRISIRALITKCEGRNA